MTFTVTPLFGSEFQESAARFAKDANQNNSTHLSSNEKHLLRERKWNEAIELGWAACLIPEHSGGLGASLEDFCGLLEGTAQYALPLPISSGMGLPAILLSSLDFKGKDELLSSISEGSVRIQPIFQTLDPFVRQMSREMTLRIETQADSNVLSGKVSGVEQIPGATHFLLCCANQQNVPGLWLIPCQEVHPALSLEIRIDSRDSMSLTFQDQPLSNDRRIAHGPALEKAFEKMFNYGALFSCVEAAACMGSVLEQTIRYLSERKQFGVTLSTFQVLRHDIADVYAKYDSIRAFVTAFVRRVSATGDCPSRELSLLKLYLSEVGPKLAHTVIQVHGGMGMTEELWATRLNKRILMTNLEFGDGQFHAERALTTTQAD